MGAGRRALLVACVLYAALLGTALAGRSSGKLSPQRPLATKHDVTKLGAKGDGRSDSTPAIMKAWKDACAAPGRHKIIIPKGNYLTAALLFEGPCKASSIIIRLNGNLLGTGDLNAYKSDWITVNYVDNFVFEGLGTIDGQGPLVWNRNECNKKHTCKTLPNSLVMNFVNNATIRGLTLKDSKFFHVNLFKCRNVIVKKVNIVAPEDSPNTDGIHMGDSEYITIRNTNIGVGDDCISIGPGSKHIKVRDTRCGPGHGISVGSLGRYANEADVEDLDIRNCTMKGTSNGLRIKTYEDSKSELKASKFLYDDIVMVNVSYPILVDQKYCPNNICSRNSNSKISVHDVVFKNIRGTSATPEAVKLNCDKKIPCLVELVNIDLKYIGAAKNRTMAICNNAIGRRINVAKELSCL